MLPASVQYCAKVWVQGHTSEFKYTTQTQRCHVAWRVHHHQWQHCHPEVRESSQSGGDFRGSTPKILIFL